MSAPTSSRGDFWSRRKASVEAEQKAERDARLAELIAEEEAKLAEKTDEDYLAELDLPEPEEMESTEQVQTLLKSTVPQRLKTRALRRLWRLNPVLANVDGLVDYGEDFTDAAMVVENMATTYQVGKGMLKAIEWESPKPVDAREIEAAEEEAEALAAAEAAELTDEPTPALSQTDETPQGAPALTAEAPADADMPTAEIDTAEGPAPATPRRMRFRFDTAT